MARTSTIMNLEEFSIIKNLQKKSIISQGLRIFSYIQ